MAESIRVLIVDEDLDSRVETRKALQRAKLESVGETGFGAEATSTAAAQSPDLILIAVEEPVVRPLETAESLANILPDTPLIFYSSLDDPQSVRRGALYGARDYLVKPLQADSLKKAVLRALEFEERRHMRQAGQLARAPVNGTVITVAGTKGGIGKSVLAVNLALALHQRSTRRVALVDADTSFGDLATMLDLTPEVTATDLLRDIGKIEGDEVADYLAMTGDGLSLLATPADGAEVWEEAGPEAAKKVVELLSTNHDFVVVDTSGSMDRFVRALVEISTLVLMVSTGEVSSVRDTAAALKRLARWDTAPEKIKVVLNRGAKADGFQLNDLEQAFDRSVFWEIPRDKEIGRAVQLGQPVVLHKPNTPAARNFTALAAVLGGNAVMPASIDNDSPGFFARLRGQSLRKVTP